MPRSPIAILGGSFNPLHIGHLRLAIEIHEMFAGLPCRVDLLPCAHPPHKAEDGLLPFAIRAEIIRKTIAPYPWLYCSTVEEERKELSYTWNTLAAYREKWPDTPLFFVLGSSDYELLPTWHNGLRIPERCSLVVLPRGTWGTEEFFEATSRLWPGCSKGTSPLPAADAVDLPHGNQVLFLPVPWLDISASEVRSRWLQGRSVDFLLSPETVSVLRTHEDSIRLHWKAD